LSKKEHGVASKKTETTSELDSDKAHVHESEGTLSLTGDSGHEKGGTRELKVIEEVHSTSSDT
jgi:hypothetical protein